MFKQLILIVTFFSLLSTSVLAQVTSSATDFPDSNFSWNESLMYSDYEFNVRYDVERTFYDAGDTIINNTHYRKLNQIKIYRRYKYISTMPYVELEYIENEEKLFACIYNDTYNKEVYIRLEGDSLDQKLFDFNYNIGDTLDLDFYTNYYKTIYIVEIGNVKDPDGVNRRFFRFSDDIADTLDDGTWHEETASLIEGIGMSKGLFGGMVQPFERAHFGFNCINLSPTKSYDINDGLQLFSYLVIHSVDSCKALEFEYLNVDNEKINSINIYPNPSLNLIKIDTDQSIQKIEIYDQSLKIVFEQYNLDYNYIDISELSNGIYHCRIYTEKDTLIGKFLKN
jgi:hypothetical protein